MKALIDNKKVARFLYFFTTLILFLVLITACNKNESISPEAQAYITMAQEFIDNGDYESALNILQKGYNETKSTAIAIKITELTTSTDANSISEEKVDAVTQSSFTQYVGTWAEVSANWSNGGMVLDIEILEDTMNLKLSYTQAAPACRIAACAHTITLSKIEDNTVTFSFEDDGWGNSGTITLKLSEDRIICFISEVKTNEGSFPLWGFYEDEFSLIKNEDAHYLMSDAGVDYTEPTSAILNASTVLANLGVTEEEFRSRCQKLFSENIQIGSPDGTEAYFFDLFEYPKQYVNNWYVIDNILGYDFECMYKGKTTDGLIYYIDTSSNSGPAMIVDLRDDPYSPNIQESEVITPYVIFMGLEDSNYGEMLVFLMISFDK